jgi:hypothetical protein
MDFSNTRLGGSYSAGSEVKIFRWQRKRQFRSLSLLHRTAVIGYMLTFVTFITNCLTITCLRTAFSAGSNQSDFTFRAAPASLAQRYRTPAKSPFFYKAILNIPVAPSFRYLQKFRKFRNQTLCQQRPRTMSSFLIKVIINAVPR